MWFCERQLTLSLLSCLLVSLPVRRQTHTCAESGSAVAAILATRDEWERKLWEPATALILICVCFISFSALLWLRTPALFYSLKPSSWTASERTARPLWRESLRILSSFLILTYAVRKLIGGGQFGLINALSSRPVGTLSGFELTWYYYGYSHAYGVILGLTQALGGLLLLFRRSALLGASVLVPIMVNILMINVFFRIAVGAELVAAFVLISSLLLLWHARSRLIALFWSDQYGESALSLNAEWIASVLVGILLLLEAVVFAKHSAR